MNLTISMEYLGAAYSVAQSLFEAVQNPALQEMCSVWGYESELESLQRTVDSIKAMLLDAESKQDRGEVLTHHAQQWFEQLKDAIYDADDLFDTFVTLAEQKQQRDNDTEGVSLFKKVRQFCSFDNPLLVAYKMSRDVREVRNKLDSIAENHDKFGFKFDSEPIRRRREETCSYVHAQDIIGRKDDVEKIVGRLVDPDVQHDISCLAIVGVGGLGKTTLAQLVYNDDRVKENFPNMRLWVCVGDLDKAKLDVKAILCKILHSVTSGNHEHLSLDRLQRQVREHLGGNKFFLVFDDLWNEVRDQWLDLAKFLRDGLMGSWILVTTRSEKSAEAVGDKDPYRLEGLSQEDSWSLFEMAAFGQGAEQADPDLVDIGEEIVKKCAGVPLAIRVVGSLLYDQGKDKWVSLKKAGLGRLRQGDHQGIEPILKFSYHNLESPLKACFTYCALFPKDHFIRKEELIMLWIAQGFVIPLDEGQSVEDAGEEYFSILLKRCFFQDVKKDFNGEIIECKIHDLMHDIAEEVAGKEIVKGKFIGSALTNKVRHLHVIYEWNADPKSQVIFNDAKLRTCLIKLSSTLSFDTAIANWKCLRALSLDRANMAKLQSAFSELLCLRYLDLSNSGIVALPNSIAKLHNLEFLILKSCQMLREFPKDLGKLTKLKVLDTSACCSLTHVPRGMGKLRCLQKLPFIVLGEGTSDKEGGKLAHQPQEIKALQNLKGSLAIQVKIPADAEYIMESGSNRGCLSRYLVDILIVFFDKDFFIERRTRICEVDEALLEDLLQPHPDSNLKELVLSRYHGRRMPNWAREGNLARFLPNLVKVGLKYCHKLQEIGMLGTLPKLKSLELEKLDDLEYIENTTRGKGALVSQPSFFTSLETLKLVDLPKLKGWWREESNSNQIDAGGLILPSVPCLSNLSIRNCPNFASMPLFPTIEDLQLQEFNVNLPIMESVEARNSKLRSLRIDDVAHLKLAMPMEALQCLCRLDIASDFKLEKLSEVEEMFHSFSSSLRELSIRWCSNLKSLSGGLKHLTALEELVLLNLPNLSLSKEGEGEGEEDSDDDGMPWRSLQHSLRSLELGYLLKLVKLPNGMRHLTSLKSLKILNCESLESIPEWMPELTSLKQLHIERCSASLHRRCCEDTGEDWPSIHHIPNLDTEVYSSSSDEDSEAEFDGDSEAESDGEPEAESDGDSKAESDT